MKKKQLTAACLLAGMTMVHVAGNAAGNCLDCHETSACQTPTKPQGTCADCHVGAVDVNDYQMNFAAATIANGEWQGSGHGRAGISLACEHCHTYGVGHGQPANPFRLANTMTPGAAGQNSVCLICHGTGSAGFDPDGAGPLPLVNGSVKIDANHSGARHDQASDGGSFCWDCHDPHGDDNIMMIHAEVTKESDGSFGVPAVTAPVTFSANGIGSDYARSSAPYDGVCQACHTSTNHYTATSGDGHNDAYNCLLCHEHVEGFKPNCNACHGYPPVVDMPQGIDGLVIIPQITGSSSAGAHQLHVGAYGYSCYTCHAGGMPDSPITDDYRVQMGFDIQGFSGNGSLYNGQALLNGYVYEGTNGTAIGNGTPTTCENMYCHSNGTAVATSFADPTTFSGPHQSSPVWNGTTSCTSCHEYGPSYSMGQPKANQHKRHLDLFNVLASPNYDENPCHFCHYGTTSDGATITNRANHVNRRYDVSPNTTAIYWQNDGTPKAVNFTYTYDAGGGTCSNITCHQGILNETITWGSSIEAGYSWSPGIGCGSVNFTITVTSSDAVPPFEYKVDWESDGVWDYIGPNHTNSFIYPNTSTKYITYSVRDAAGRTLEGDGTKKTGPISPSSTNALPVVSVTPTVAGYTVTLTDHSYDPDYDSCGHSGAGRVRIDWRDGVIETPALNLTDDPAGTGQQFTHTYSSSGSRSIRYYVYDNVITYPVTYTLPAVTVPQN